MNHFFVIGTATGLIAYLSLHTMAVGQDGIGSILTVAFLVGSVLGFWGWWYETYAIKSGFITIYTKRIADGASAEEAVTDYAPLLFGSMGACHGAMVKAAENMLLPEHSMLLYWTIAVIGGVALIAVPGFLYLVAHRIRYGESGLRSYRNEISQQSRSPGRDK